jgi:hypothetical protein
MSERWRNHYDGWKLIERDTTTRNMLDEDGEPIDQDELDAQAEAAAEERAERQREDAIFDREDRDERA